MVDEDWVGALDGALGEGSRVRRGARHPRRRRQFPSDMALGSAEGLEEERRLFYVAVTRARKNLAIYIPLRYHHHRVRDDHSWVQPSRFLSDSVRATLEEVPCVESTSQSRVVRHGGHRRIGPRRRTAVETVVVRAVGLTPGER